MIPRDTRKIAIGHNNNGVRLLRTGDLPGAILEVAKGLDMMKSIMENPATVEMDTQQHNDNVDHDDSDSMVQTEEEGLSLAFLETSCCEGSSDGAMDYQQHQPSYVFCSPIEISAEFSSLPTLKLSLLMVFNLALAHHLHGIHSSDYVQLEKALRLYECVYRISHEEEVHLSVLHAMALTNNMGHVHLNLHDTHKSQKCFEQLLATLIYFVEVSGDGDNSKKEMESLQGFFSNATGLSMPKGSAPAA